MVRQHYMTALLQKQEKEIKNLVSRLVKHKNALYHPETKKKLFIQNGICSKSECNIDKEHKILKVLLPLQSRKDFRQEIALDRIGKAVVCFTHFFFQHQKYYLINGVFPEGVRLLRGKENLKNAEGIRIPDATPFPEKRDPQTGKMVSGFKVCHQGAHENSDWVCNLITCRTYC